MPKIPTGLVRLSSPPPSIGVLLLEKADPDLTVQQKFLDLGEAFDSCFRGHHFPKSGVGDELRAFQTRRSGYI